MDNTDNTNKLDQKLQIMLTEVRGKILVANMSLATDFDTPFIATYENKDGICCMAMRVDNTAILAATATGGSIIHKSDIIITPDGIGERKAVFKCEEAEEAEHLWELITDRMYDWSQGEIEVVDIE